ncbi:MAG TPA: Ppx/GppA phosphatase family protein [Acidobacteriaceae bacterium]|jgi:exopolyphosphatase/guanosine-5'-triphosphate,3'-diphosphate pyrophosphatase|nr:Ppx/GppA phosphatase family protein [Acidobacteriaceae bacterium]
MQTFAAIDIGSNSCRLKIGSVVQHRLRIVHEDREVTRLGASVFETGIVSPEAMAATLRTLKRFYKAVQLNGTDKVRAVATSAMRDARNSRAFQAWVRDETGWDVEIISGLEEGRLIHRGVVENEPGAGGRCVLVDIGGGSCEITVSEHKRIHETISLPLGAVRLTQEFLRSDVPAKDEVRRLRQFIDRELRKAKRRIHPEHIRLVIGTSGTAAALFDAGRALGKGRASKQLVPTPTVRRLTSKLTKMKPGERSAVPGIGPKRSEIIIAGAQVFAEILEGFGLPGFRYSPMGLRDGILAQMLAEQDSRASIHQQFERERWQAVEEACRRYGIDPRQAEPVRQHAAQMFRDLAAVHDLPPEYRTWLEAAAMLRDIGKFLNHQGYHRHAQYIIANSELYGFTPQQRVVTSAIARYQGKSRPAPEGRTMRQVPPEEYEHVRRAVVLLRLAVALNQDRASDVLKVRVRVYPKRVLLELLPGRTGAELELWSLRKEASYFREVFGRDLFVALA